MAGQNYTDKMKNDRNTPVVNTVVNNRNIPVLITLIVSVHGNVNTIRIMSIYCSIFIVH